MFGRKIKAFTVHVFFTLLLLYPARTYYVSRVRISTTRNSMSSDMVSSKCLSFSNNSRGGWIYRTAGRSPIRISILLLRVTIFSERHRYNFFFSSRLRYIFQRTERIGSTIITYLLSHHSVLSRPRGYH